MRPGSYSLAILFFVALLVVLGDRLIPTEAIVYPTEVKASALLRRAPHSKPALPNHLERFLPRETSNDVVTTPRGLPENSAQLQGMIEANPVLFESAKNYLESQGNSEEAQKAIVNQGFQKYFGRAPQGSEEQAGLQALRELLPGH